MADFPTFRQAEKIIRSALPCEGCDCTHRSARVNVYLDENDTLRATNFRLGCGKVATVSLEIESEPEPEEEVVEDVATSETDELVD